MERDGDPFTRTKVQQDLRAIEEFATALVTERDDYQLALQQIAAEDYRGPEPYSKRVARKALAKWGQT